MQTKKKRFKRLQKREINNMGQQNAQVITQQAQGTESAQANQSQTIKEQNKNPLNEAKPKIVIVKRKEDSNIESKKTENLDYTSPNPMQTEINTEKKGQESREKTQEQISESQKPKEKQRAQQAQNEQAIQKKGQEAQRVKTQATQKEKQNQEIEKEQNKAQTQQKEDNKNLLNEILWENNFKIAQEEINSLKTHIEYLQRQIDFIFDAHDRALDLIKRANDKIDELSVNKNADKAIYEAKAYLNDGYVERLKNLEKSFESLKNDQEGTNEALITEIKAIQNAQGNAINMHAGELEYQRNLIKRANDKIITTQTTEFSNNLRHSETLANLAQEVENIKEEQKALRNEIANARFLITNYKEKTLWEIIKMKLS